MLLIFIALFAYPAVICVDIAEHLKTMTVKMPNGDMPILGLGTADAQAQAPPFTCADAVEAALKIGYRHIDTAIFYENHADIKEGIKRSGIPREEIWITSKIAMHGSMLRAQGKPGRDTTVAFVDGMLAQLETSYMDLVLTHFPAIEGEGLKVHNDIEMEGDLERANAIRAEIWKALESLVEVGKVRNIGVSNYLVPHLEEMSLYATIMPAVNQLELHPYLPRTDVREWCGLRKIIVEAYGSVVQDIYPDLLAENDVKRIASAHNASPGQVALSWALEKKIVVIPKSSKPARIEENAKALGLTLTKEDIAALDALDCSRHSNCRFPTRCGSFCTLGTYYWDPAQVPAFPPSKHEAEL
mmetsp:Transcript_154002/g.271954  ORF Transcript_154002/g.271954 Transcript_154002/m.271954 type:complete len:357 (-) Transcript_154002:278-1348(-)